MKINKLNYENFVIDYIEGTLSIELKKDFDLFLEKNEEVYEEIKDYISAPILEESNEIYVNKKSLKKTEKFNPFYLLAVIPFLMLGAYFLLPSKIEATTPKNDFKTEEVINQFAQEEKASAKQDLDLEIKPVVKKEIKTLPKKKTQSKQKTTKVNTTTKKEVFFASADKKQLEIEKNISPIQIKKEQRPQAMLQSIASVDALPLNVFETKINVEVLEAVATNFISTEKSFKDELFEKNAWLEMVTPASFGDINLKESLAIETNVNINTGRKIINAFIPQSLVK